MTIFSPNAGYDSFTIDPGELVFVPRGYIHDIENTMIKKQNLLLHSITNSLKRLAYPDRLAPCLIVF